MWRDRDWGTKTIKYSVKIKIKILQTSNPLVPQSRLSGSMTCMPTNKKTGFISRGGEQLANGSWILNHLALEQQLYVVLCVGSKISSHILQNFEAYIRNADTTHHENKFVWILTCFYLLCENYFNLIFIHALQVVGMIQSYESAYQMTNVLDTRLNSASLRTQKRNMAAFYPHFNLILPSFYPFHPHFTLILTSIFPHFTPFPPSFYPHFNLIFTVLPKQMLPSVSVQWNCKVINSSHKLKYHIEYFI